MVHFKNEIAIDRLEGYKKALIECNLSYNTDYVFEGKYKIEWGQEFIKI